MLVLFDFGTFDEVKSMRLQFDPTGKDMPHFIIPFTMPSLNEYLSACNRNPHVGAKMKRENMMLASNSIRRYLRRWHTDKKVILHYHIYEPNKKRDKDNCFAMVSKCVQDALVSTKVLNNDGWSCIENFTHDFFISKQARIEVWIEEIDD